MSYNRSPEWARRTLFLKVLVEGHASLYYYKSRELEKFFFSINSGPIEQLVHKYFLRSITLMDQNLTYLNQLKQSVNCTGISDAEFKKIRYTRMNLQKHFARHNACRGITDGTETKKRRGPSVKFGIAPGADLQNFKVDNGFNFVRLYPRGTGFRFGIPVEGVLPFNKNKWSLIVEPVWQSYHADDRVIYRSIELTAGGRHYFYLRTKPYFFINALTVTDLPLKYEVNDTIDLEGTFPSFSFAAGVGLGYGRLSLEGRWYFERSILATQYNVFLVYNKQSLMLCYRF